MAIRKPVIVVGLIAAAWTIQHYGVHPPAPDPSPPAVVSAMQPAVVEHIGAPPAHETLMVEAMHAAYCAKASEGLAETEGKTATAEGMRLMQANKDQWLGTTTRILLAHNTAAMRRAIAAGSRNGEADYVACIEAINQGDDSAAQSPACEREHAADCFAEMHPL